MIKAFLYNSKDKAKSAYFWNSCSAMLTAFQTVIILMLISRIDPITDAGVFTIAFAIGNLMMTIGKYGVRQFQVSDVAEKYSFREYVLARIVTCSVMCIVSLIYVGYDYANGLYSMDKCLIVLFTCLARVIDSFEDVLHGMLQQHQRLDIAGKILTIRMATYIVVYLVSYFITKNLVFTSIISCGISFIEAIVINYIAIKDFEVGKSCLHYKESVQLLLECFPLFISTFLVMYISNAPKYAIDNVLSSADQAYFTYIFMPVFVVSLLSQFVYQPVISRLAMFWHNGEIEKFKRLIFGQIGIIVLLSFAVVIGGYFLGIPVLSLIYSVDLTEYKNAMVVLLLGGSVLAVVNFLQMVITVVRKQKLLILGYLFAFIAFVVLGKKIVALYGIMGISVFYTVVVVGIALIFAILTVKIIADKKKA